MQMIKNSFLANVITATSGKLTLTLLQFFSTMILARLLVPEDFGILAMCTIFTSISTLLVDSGMGGSIIYHKDTTSDDYNTVFWANFTIASILYLILFILSEFIADFYQEQRLSLIIKTIGLSIIIHSICIIQSTLLTKQLNFKRQNFILVLSSFINSIIAIGLAFSGAGVWSLVSQAVFIKVIEASLYIYFGSYKPKFTFSTELLKKHWNFGAKLLGASLLKVGYQNIYVQLIGKTLHLKDAGFFNQANRLNDVPQNIISYPFERVVFPMLANTSNLSKKINHISRIFAITIVPLLLLGSLISKDIVPLMLGKNWTESGWILSYLLLGSVGSSLEALYRSFIKSTGKTSILLKYEIFKRIVNVAIVLLGLFWGINGILIAFIVNGWIGFLFNLVALNTAYKFDIKKNALNLFYSLMFSILPFIIFYLFLEISTGSSIANIAIISLIYLSTYIVLLLIFHRNIILGLYKLLKK